MWVFVKSAELGSLAGAAKHFELQTFFRYLGKCLHIPSAITIPPIPELSRQAVIAA